MGKYKACFQYVLTCSKNILKTDTGEYLEVRLAMRLSFLKLSLLRGKCLVPWNAPFYQRMGFVILSNSAIPTSLQTILDREVAQCGFKRETRCAMNFVL